MSDRSSIEWTDASWNPIRARRRLEDGTILTGWHCVHASEGCRHCYAEGFNRRLGTKLPYKPGLVRTEQRPNAPVELFLDAKMLLLPLKWKRSRKIFVGSMTDVFADFVADEWLDLMFAVMALCPQHTFQVLTKRPERMRRYMATPDRKRIIALQVMKVSNLLARAAQSHEARIKLDHFSTCFKGAGPFPNVWLGTSIEDRPALLDRIGHLRVTPAAVRFVSFEPLIGDIGAIVLDGIHWAIVGGESGSGARDNGFHASARSILAQCRAAGVAFFGKQDVKKAELPEDLRIREFPAVPA